MKEFLQGRRLGYALRPALGHVGLGLGVAATILDLMAWFAWGSSRTNAFVIGAYWVVIAAALLTLAAGLAAVAELRDIPGDERPLARLDVVAIFGAAALYVLSAALRAGDQGAAGASPAALLSAFAGLILLVAGGVIGSNLYAAREWEVIDAEEDEPRRRHPRRSRAG
ncbi:MAG TPA: hypothetical protein VIN34_10985 [Candidatus Limnocylindria bacterium]|jgi:uncharacterized membrane protein